MSSRAVIFASAVAVTACSSPTMQSAGHTIQSAGNDIKKVFTPSNAASAAPASAASASVAAAKPVLTESHGLRVNDKGNILPPNNSQACAVHNAAKLSAERSAVATANATGAGVGRIAGAIPGVSSIPGAAAILRGTTQSTVQSATSGLSADTQARLTVLSNDCFQAVGFQANATCTANKAKDQNACITNSLNTSRILRDAGITMKP